MNRSLPTPEFPDGRQLDDGAIDWIRYCVKREGRPVIVAFSGGKDSTVILDLTRRSGVNYRAIYSLTTGDAPELVHFIRHYYPEVEWSHPEHSYWTLIEDKGLPDLKQAPRRYCCQQLKEQASPTGSLVITGIRAQESTTRSRRLPLELGKYTKTNVMICNPILYWRHEDVWTYIRERHLPVCPLYAEGFHRLGCVICCYNRDIRRSIRRWPKLAAAAQRALARRWAKGKVKPEQLAIFPTWESYWNWWLDRVEKSAPYPKPDDVEGCTGLFA